MGQIQHFQKVHLCYLYIKYLNILRNFECTVPMKAKGTFLLVALTSCPMCVCWRTPSKIPYLLSQET